jgi:hypothetical protein
MRLLVEKKIGSKKQAFTWGERYESKRLTTMEIEKIIYRRDKSNRKARRFLIA